MAPSSRSHAVRWFLVLLVVPPVAAVLIGGPRLGGLLALMWLLIVGTVGLAMVSRGEEKPNGWDPRGRLHG